MQEMFTKAQAGRALHISRQVVQQAVIKGRIAVDKNGHLWIAPKNNSSVAKAKPID